MSEKFFSKFLKKKSIEKEAPATPEDFHGFEEKMGPKLLELSKLSSPGFKRSKEATKKIFSFVFKKILPVYVAYLGSVYFTQKPDGKFSEKDRAKVEMETKGITSEQASTYKLGMSETLYRSFTPFLYSENDPMTYVRAVPNAVFGRDNVLTLKPGQADAYEAELIMPSSEDAWRLYLGLPQENNTFNISDYQPENSKENKYYYKINGFQKAFEEFIAHHQNSNILYLEGENFSERFLSYIEDLHKKGDKKVVDSEIQSDTKMDSLVNAHSQKIRIEGGDDIALALNKYTMSCGQDEKGSYLSYYDKWDLNGLTENSGKGLGRAFEIYDRIYYNPQTGEIIDPLLNK